MGQQRIATLFTLGISLLAISFAQVFANPKSNEPSAVWPSQADYDKILQVTKENKPRVDPALHLATFTTFEGKLDLEEQRITQPIDYSHYLFDAPVRAQLTKFTQPVDFELARFKARANFANATFEQNANFNWTKFSAASSFGHGHFKKNVGFYRAHFLKAIDFYSSKFEKMPTFVGVTFDDKATFSDARFKAGGDFHNAQFSKTVNFHGSSFGLNANFSRTSFKTAIFDRVKFSNQANFAYAKFGGPVSFDSATMPRYIDFSHIATINKKIDFTTTQPYSYNIKTLINLINTDISKINIRYTNFKLYFPDDTPNVEKEVVYEQLLNKFLKNSYINSYKDLAKEYKTFQYLRDGHTFINAFQKNMVGLRF